MNNLPYDRTSKDSIYEYALNLLNKSFKDILKEKYELREDSAHIITMILKVKEI